MGTTKKWWDDVADFVLPKPASKAIRKASSAQKRRSSRSPADRAMISSARRSGSGTVARRRSPAKRRPRRKK